jgi:hypothetical protein
MTANESAIDMTLVLEQAFLATTIVIAETGKGTERNHTSVVRTLGRKAASWIMATVDRAVCGDEGTVKESPETPRSVPTSLHARYR